MNERNLKRLQIRLEAEYQKKTARSRALYGRAGKSMIGGGSHTIRLYPPYPFFVSGARGAEVRDIDGREYVDYWQGHYANILGHNPAPVLAGTRDALRRGALHTGFEGPPQIDLAEIVLASLGYRDWRIRFTTSGTLAAMYAVMLARAHTGRDLILKVGGGWHGASPDLLKGVKYDRAAGFTGAASAGVPAAALRRTLVARFNDEADLARIFKARGDRIAAFLVEPFLGVGGFIAAAPAYLRLARELTHRYGAALVFDEVISGFRFCASGIQTLYGIEPDLTLFGKIIGGGHAVAAVAGKRDIMEGCGLERSAARRALVEGGTFSGHSEYMAAGVAMLRHLVGNAGRLYPRLAAMGEILRRGIEAAFAAEEIEARATGDGNEVVRGGSLFMLHFPIRSGVAYDRSEDSLDDRISRLRLREDVLKLALILEGVHVVHGGGAVSNAHREKHLNKTLAAYASVARLFKKYLF
jgi:glutamate-1-semialdehyde 2,1-aminomutase